MKTEPLHLQITNKFISRLKKTRVFNSAELAKLKIIINRQIINEKDIEVLLTEK